MPEQLLHVEWVITLVVTLVTLVLAYRSTRKVRP
jgi:hypothetical protein